MDSSAIRSEDDSPEVLEASVIRGTMARRAQWAIPERKKTPQFLLPVGDGETTKVPRYSGHLLRMSVSAYVYSSHLRMSAYVLRIFESSPYVSLRTPYIRVISVCQPTYIRVIAVCQPLYRDSPVLLMSYVAHTAMG
jgi:hypothetical protein